MTLGIDIGGTNLCLGLVNDGILMQRFSTPSFEPGASLEQTLDYLSTQIDRILSPGTQKIGIGVPSVVDVKRGIVYDTQNIPSWKEVPLKAHLEAKYQVPVAVNNDANCFAMGAYGTFPENARPEVLVGITLGTGVGMGIVENGRLFCGYNCGAGELGCLPYRNSIIEDYVSKKFFVDKPWDAHGTANAALEGNLGAIAIYEEFGRHMGALLCDVMFAYDPSHIVIGGGIANAYALFRPAMEAYLKQNFPYRKALERVVIQPLVSDDVQLIGASMI